MTASAKPFSGQMRKRKEGHDNELNKDNEKFILPSRKFKFSAFVRDLLHGIALFQYASELWWWVPLLLLLYCAKQCCEKVVKEKVATREKGGYRFWQLSHYKETDSYANCYFILGNWGANRVDDVRRIYLQFLLYINISLSIGIFIQFLHWHYPPPIAYRFTCLFVLLDAMAEEEEATKAAEVSKFYLG